MRQIVIYVLITLVLKVGSRTFCDDSKCVCVNKAESFEITCTSHSAVLDVNNTIPNNATVFDLSWNNLTSIQRPLVSDTLLELLLCKNQIKEIYIEVFYLPSLKVLDLSHNNIEFINRDTFAQIRNLRYLNLASNKITTLRNVNFYHLKFLNELILDDNKIGTSLENHSLFESGCDLPDTIQSISLKNVNLNDNHLNMFTDSKESLKTLTLAHNNLSKIIVLPVNLQYLDISNNPIENISWDDFFDAIYLSVLKLNNILIDEVPDFAFLYLCSLRELELADNRKLKKISPLAWGSVIVKDQIDLLVETLSLRGANLTSLSGQLEGIFRKIKQVDLRDNPWKCDCDLAWLQKIPIPPMFLDFRCSTPQYLFNQRVLEVNSTEFFCEKKKHSEDYRNIIITIVIYCVFLVTAVIMMYLFIFSPNPFFYRVLPAEFPQTP